MSHIHVNHFSTSNPNNTLKELYDHTHLNPKRPEDDSGFLPVAARHNFNQVVVDTFSQTVLLQIDLSWNLNEGLTTILEHM